MSKKYLIAVSVAMVLVSVIGLGAFYALRGSVAAAPDWSWPETVDGKRLDEAQQRVEVDALRAKASGTVKFLAGAEAAERFTDAGSTKYDFSSSYDTRLLFEKARFHATTSIILLWIMLACALLGLLRLRVKGMVAVSGGVMSLAILGGAALLVFTGGGTLAAVVIPIMLAGFFGQLIAANLLPGPPHPFVAAVEQQMRTMTVAQKSGFTIKRVVGGLVLVAVGIGLTVLSIGIGAGRVAVVPTGAILAGLMSMTTPLVASIRLRVSSAL